MNPEEVHEVLTETVVSSLTPTGAYITHLDDAHEAIRDLLSFTAVQRVLRRCSTMNPRNLAGDLIDQIREKLTPIQKQLNDVPEAAKAIQEVLDFATECYNELYT